MKGFFFFYFIMPGTPEYTKAKLQAIKANLDRLEQEEAFS